MFVEQLVRMEKSMQNAIGYSGFIVFEGGHGSGKTTQAKLLAKYLKENQMKARYTKEPYGHDFIRLINKYSAGDIYGSPVLMYLSAASRFIHVKDIKSWLAMGESVICDRYILSSFVYQQIQGISLDAIKKVNSFAIKPRVTFYVNVTLKERLERLHKLQKNKNGFFLKKEKLAEEQNLYGSMVHNWNLDIYGRIVVIDGEANPSKVHQNIVSHLSAEMKHPT
jgi:dTMP kinase